MQSSVIGGSPYAVQAQNPFVQSQLANTTQTGQQETGGMIPALGAAGSILGAGGSAAQGGAQAYQAFKFCWIARLLYGERAWQVARLRWYIAGPYAQTVVGAAFYRAYLRYGERVATWLAPRPWAQRLAKRWFDHLLNNAQRCMERVLEHGQPT